MNAVVRLLRTPTIASASVHGLSGACFILATLIMARTLPLPEFGAAALIIALGNIGTFGSPSGLAGVALRHDLRTDGRLLAHGSAAIVPAAGVLAAVGLGYGLDARSAIVVGLVVLAGGFAVLAQAGLRRAQQFVRASLLSQSGNFVLLLAALIMAAGFGRVAWFPGAALAVVLAASAWLSWSWLRAHYREGRPMRAALWRDALQFAGITLAAEILIQMERLLIPLALTLEDLAVFAVVAAVAIAPFRMLELGVDTTLTARLRATETPAQRRALFVREGRLLLLACVAGSAAIAALGMPIAAFVLEEPDRLSWSLLIAAVVSGLARVLAAVGRAVAGAFCSSSELARVSLGAWLALGVGAAAGLAFSGAAGLVGLVYGVALGWLVRGAYALAVAGRHVRG